MLKGLCPFLNLSPWFWWQKVQINLRADIWDPEEQRHNHRRWAWGPKHTRHRPTQALRLCSWEKEKPETDREKKKQREIETCRRQGRNTSRWASYEKRPGLRLVQECVGAGALTSGWHQCPGGSSGVTDGLGFSFPSRKRRRLNYMSPVGPPHFVCITKSGQPG